jgi:branched-chain amino acid transport system substrate-binding protein
LSQLDRRGALRLFASLGAAGVAAPLLSACSDSDSGGTAASKGTVRIGLLVPQTGANKPIGDDMLKGFDLFRSLNNGRFGGYDVQTVLADEGATADTGKAAAEKLVNQDKVHAVTGVATSAVMLAVKDTFEAAHIPLIGSNASPTNLLSTLYIWRTSYVDRDPGAALGEYVASILKPPPPAPGTTAPPSKSAFVIAPEGLGRDAVEGFLEKFRLREGRIEGNVTYVPAGQTNFIQNLNPLKGSQVGAVVSFFSGAGALAFVKQYSDLGIKNSALLFAPGFLTEGNAMLQAHGAAARGIFTAMNYSADLDNSANRRFASEYQREHGITPTAYAMASYDAATVLDKALSLLNGNVTGETLNAAIGRVGQISSPRGDWQFNQTRSPLQKWYLREVRADGTDASNQPLLANMVISELATIG